MEASWQGRLQDETATHAFGQSLAQRAQPGDCVALVGEMGAGKTTLTRAMAEAFGVDIRQQFGSPTYTYANEYAGERGTMVHIDLYRVDTEQSAMALGLDDTLLRRDAFIVVEWADKAPSLIPPHALWCRLVAHPDTMTQRQWRARGARLTGERLLGMAGTPS